MKPVVILLFVIVVSLVSVNAVFSATGKAVIHGTEEGSTIGGEVTLTDVANGLAISAAIIGAPPGKHGFHIHTYGSCEEGGKAAGGHYNPANTQHGLLIKDGSGKAHAGDLGNIDIAEDGTGTLELVVSGISLSGAQNPVAGRAIILHAKADDLSQPTGNAGARIGCGTIVITGH
jgi:superoxide dismutase, Cu-Zn family